MVDQDSVSKFRLAFLAVLKKYPEDDKSKRLIRVVELLCEAATIQKELIELEADEMFQIDKVDLHTILDEYIPMFNQFKKLPRLEVGSSYEICVPSSIYTVITSHSSSD